MPTTAHDRLCDAASDAATFLDYLSRARGLSEALARRCNVEADKLRLAAGVTVTPLADRAVQESRRASELKEMVSLLRKKASDEETAGVGAGPTWQEIKRLQREITSLS